MNKRVRSNRFASVRTREVINKHFQVERLIDREQKEDWNTHTHTHTHSENANADASTMISGNG